MKVGLTQLIKLKNILGNVLTCQESESVLVVENNVKWKITVAVLWLWGKAYLWCLSVVSEEQIFSFGYVNHVFWLTFQYLKFFLISLIWLFPCLNIHPDKAWMRRDFHYWPCLPILFLVIFFFKNIWFLLPLYTITRPQIKAYQEKYLISL